MVLALRWGTIPPRLTLVARSCLLFTIDIGTAGLLGRSKLLSMSYWLIGTAGIIAASIGLIGLAYLSYRYFDLRMR